MVDEKMSWLATLKKRIEFVLPATTNPTQRTVFMEWLQLCDKIEEEQRELFTSAQVKAVAEAINGCEQMPEDQIDALIQSVRGEK